MDAKDFLKMQLEGNKRSMGRAVNTLTQAEIMWRPSCGCNSIGLIIFHVARSEDSFIQARLQNKPEVWVKEGWFKKLNMAEAATGSHFTIDEVNAFPVPELKDLHAYTEAVRAATAAYVDSLTPADFDRKLTIKPFPGDTTVGAMLSMTVTHAAGHIGEISYIRGLQRGMDK